MASLDAYRRRRDLARSTEPDDPPQPRAPAREAPPAPGLAFVVQKHGARRLHYDFRLELDGTLKSWAVPKGPSVDPRDKRMAIPVEDHPLSYAGFEGEIPPGHYGAGAVSVWDRGTWTPVGDPQRGLAEGKLAFVLDGQKLHGHWALVRMRKRDEAKPVWLLLKELDAYAQPGVQITETQPDGIGTPPPGDGGRAGAKAPARPRPARAAAVRAATAAAPATATAAAGDRFDALLPEALLARAPQAALPPTLAPQLATAAEAPPAAGGAGWLVEIKYDGYRLLVRKQGDEVRCFTRRGLDWSARLPPLVDACRRLPVDECWLDGEILVADDDGRPDFQSLQSAFEAGRSADIVYCLFDLPYAGGRDLRALPLAARRDTLERLLACLGGSAGPLRFSTALAGDVPSLLEQARRGGLEGLILKRADARYQHRRTSDWLKLKTRLRQEFVVAGYSDPQGARSGFGALLLGVYDEAGSLRFAGSVGSGFDEAALHRLAAQLAPLRAARSGFADAPAKVGTTRRQVPHWLRPELVAEVSFSGWTRDGHVRHAVFHGLREDLPPGEVRRERVAQVSTTASTQAPAPAPPNAHATPAHAASAAGRPRRKAAGRAAPATPASFAVTHAERVVDPESGLTKGDLARHYARVAALMRPHLQDRPVALLRAPRGLEGTLFFQKHAERAALPEVTQLDPALDPGHAPLLVADTPAALATLAQMNVVEIHTWNATSRAFDRPDRIVFDLDPGEGVAWAGVRDGAKALHGFLEALGLACFVKTSGGKGLHLVVPLRPQEGWDEVKAFSRAVVQHVASVLPQHFVAVSGAARRVGRIYIDFLRNGFGATTVAAWSVRARPGLGVSVPLGWQELDRVEAGNQWTVATLDERIAIGNLPWQGYEGARGRLAGARRALGLPPLRKTARERPGPS